MDRVASHAAEGIDDDIASATLGYVSRNFLRCDTEPTLYNENASIDALENEDVRTSIENDALVEFREEPVALKPVLQQFGVMVKFLGDIFLVENHGFRLLLLPVAFLFLVLIIDHHLLIFHPLRMQTNHLFENQSEGQVFPILGVLHRRGVHQELETLVLRIGSQTSDSSAYAMDGR